MNGLDPGSWRNRDTSGASAHDRAPSFQNVRLFKITTVVAWTARLVRDPASNAYPKYLITNVDGGIFKLNGQRR